MAPALHFLRLGFLTLILTGTFLQAQDAVILDPDVAAIRTRYDEDLAKLQKAAEKEKASLIEPYVALLAKLEEKLQATGDLDRVLPVRQEREKVAADGKITAVAATPDFQRARESYLIAIEALGKRTLEKQQELKSEAMGRLKSLETDFTKSGKIPAAIAARDERERLAADTPPAAAPAKKMASLAAPSLPDDAPPLSDESNPFKNTTFHASITLPAGHYRLRERIAFGKTPDDKQIVVVLSDGSDLSATRDVELFLGDATFIARKSTLSGMTLRGDLSSRGFFADCVIKDSTIGKGGGWFGGDYGSRWHFERCTIERSLLPEFVIEKTGLRLIDCTVRGLEIPTIRFGKTKISEAAPSDWLQVRRTRFEQCKIPLSFLLITDACTFVNCTFVDDTDPVPVLDKPVTVTLYELNSIWRTKAPLLGMTVNKLPLEYLK
jgi:hypothetical protein